MDIVIIVGRTSFNFKAQDGNQVSGYKFHCTADAPVNDPNFKGKQVLSFTVSEAKYNQWLNSGFFIPELGDEAVIHYNRYGKVDQFGITPKSINSTFPNEAPSSKK